MTGSHKHPLVSILIPAFNSGRWIARAIQSALDQTWGSKEIIVVDDGSTDDTLAVAKLFASTSVQVVSQENRGAAAARNTAYTLCQGDYIQWLDADDILDQRKIALQVEALIKNGFGPQTLLSSAWGRFLHRLEKARFIATGLWCDLDPAEWMLRQMERNLHMQTATWLASRELTDIAGPWDSRMLTDDDGEYFCRMMVASDGIRFVPEAKVFYRRSGSGSLSYIGFSREKMRAQFLSMQLHIQYLRSLRDDERARAACIKYLQTWLMHFYPDELDIVREAQELASSLGGRLDAPRLSWKYNWIRKLFGWNWARRSQILLPKLKHDVIRHYDWILYRLQS